jgi:hypothetical protein
MSFKVSGLPRAPFQPFLRMSDAELREHGGVWRTADSFPGFPCRVSLEDAEPGEKLLLINFEHLSVASPYRSRHAIFVREHAREVRPEVDEIPQVLARRLLSVRAFDADGMMIGAEVVEGRELAPMIEKLLAPASVHYLHLHNAKPGCYAARVDRA